MKRFLYVLSLALTANIMLVSCLSNKDEVTYTVYDEAAISSFTLGTLNQYQYEVSSSGKIDSLVKYQFSGSTYKMGINQVTGTIVNNDPLPAGTDTKHVVCTVLALNNGVVSIQRPDSSFTAYSALDSIDLSYERIFRVYSSDGTRSRDYQVSLNLKTVSDDYFAWIKEEVEDTTLLAGMNGMKAVALGDKVFLFGDRDGMTVALATTDGKVWTPCSGTQFNADAWKNVVVKDDYIYLLNGNMLIRSANADTWEECCDTPLSRLFGASKQELYALSTSGDMMVSADEGLNWTKDSLDDSPALLPTDGLASVCFDYPSSDSTDYVLLVGNDGNKTQMWRKIKAYDSYAKPSRWVYMPVSTNNTQALPFHQQLSLAYIQDVLIASGNGRHVYVSLDQGITWMEFNSLPEQMKGEHVAMTFDNKRRLVTVTDKGQVWIGTEY